MVWSGNQWTLSETVCLSCSGLSYEMSILPTTITIPLQYDTLLVVQHSWRWIDRNHAWHLCHQGSWHVTEIMRDQDLLPDYLKTLQKRVNNEKNKHQRPFLRCNMVRHGAATSLHVLYSPRDHRTHHNPSLVRPHPYHKKQHTHFLTSSNCESLQVKDAMLIIDWLGVVFPVFLE